MATKAPKPDPKRKRPRGELVAEVLVKAFSDPQWEKKEAKAQADKEQRMREALFSKGVLKKERPR